MQWQHANKQLTTSATHKSPIHNYIHAEIWMVTKSRWHIADYLQLLYVWLKSHLGILQTGHLVLVSVFLLQQGSTSLLCCVKLILQLCGNKNNNNKAFIKCRKSRLSWSKAQLQEHKNSTRHIQDLKNMASNVQLNYL